jgi:hypothetical protein
MPDTLWTPDGERNVREKDVIPINQKELILLGHLHEFAHRHKVQIRCTLCDSPIFGQNNDGPDNRTPSVHCQCREWRFYR